MSEDREAFIRLLGMAHTAVLKADVEKRWNPDQPRHPAGVTEGGRFAPAGGGGVAAAAPKKPAAKPAGIPPALIPRPATSPYEAFARVGTASPGFKQHVWNSASTISPPVLQLMAQHGMKFRADKVVSDGIPQLKGKSFPGFPPGWTADAASGMYVAETRTVHIAEAPKYGKDTVPQSAESATGSVFHEYGHAFDHALGVIMKLNNASEHPDFVKTYKADVAKIPKDKRAEMAYLLQEGARGRSEAFAEIFAIVHGTDGAQGIPATYRQHFPGIVAYHEALKRSIEEPAPAPAQQQPKPTTAPAKPEPKKPAPKKKDDDEVVFQH